MKCPIYIVMVMLLVVGVSAGDVFPDFTSTYDLKADGNGCYVDGGYWMNGWGVPNASGGPYGGESYQNFCLAWEPGCTGPTRNGAVELHFNGGSEKIVVRHLDGQYNVDNFDVLVNGELVGQYADAGDSVETWEVSEFPVSGITGNQAVVIRATGEAGPSCEPWGQVAVDYINVEPDIVVPEFGIIGGVVVVIGAIGALTVLRRKH
ncbi:MAG: hypothetical protein V1743_00370 [Nanoarchaeota archaeon]